jgi:parallel beta-helix repeat protein
MIIAGIIPFISIARAKEVTLTLSDDELGTQFAREWGSTVTITDILGLGVRFDFAGLSGGGSAVGDNYPVSQKAGGTNDRIGGWGNFLAYTQYRLVFTNLGPNPISCNLFLNTGLGGGAIDTYWENGWVSIGVGQSQIVTLDFSSATAYNAQDDPVPEWQYAGGTSALIVRRLGEVANIGFQVCGNGAGSVVVSSNLPSDTVLTLPDEELKTQFAKETGPASFSATDLPGPGVRFDFTGLDTVSGTVFGDSFPVSALAAGALKDYGSGFSGPYDFSAYSKFSLLFKNVGTKAVTINLVMNTGWTNAPWGTPARDTFWQNQWTSIPSGESRVVTLDFWNAEVYNANDDPTLGWRYPDGTSGVIVRRLDEVSNIGFQVKGNGEASVIVTSALTVSLSDAELATQFAYERGPGAVATSIDVPGPGVRFDFTGLSTFAGTTVGDNFDVSKLAGGAHKTYGAIQTFSTWGDFSAYNNYKMIFTNIGSKAVTINLKLNTGWTTVPPEYAKAWRDTFWQNDWTSVAPGETKTLILDFSAAQVYNAGDELEYGARVDGTTGVAVWRLDEVSDIGFQILGDGEASIIVSCAPQCSEVYVDDGYASSTPGWGYDHFAKVQDGIDGVAFGGTVHVYDGTYNEALYISKSVTVKAGSAPVIQGSQLFAMAYGNREAVIFVKDAASVILEGLDIEGLGLGPGKSYAVAYQNSNGTIKGCTISPNTIGDLSSTGIYAISRSNLRVENCLVENFGRIGIYATNAIIDIHNNRIIGQPYTGSGDVNYGIEIEDYDGASTATITNNEIYNCGDSNPSSIWSSAAIIVDIWRYYGYNYAPSAVSIEHNDIHNNFEAIEIVSNSLSYARYNDIHNNMYGVWTDSDENGNYATFDARFNWWGDASGPNQATTNPTGLGNDAGDYVDYSPWLGFVVGTSPMTYHVNPSGGSDAIQEAIDEATDGDTVKAHPGTYYENQITISKSLVVTGSGPDTTIIDGGSATTLPAVGLVRITTNTGDVVFSEFTLKNAGVPTTSIVRVAIYASSDTSGVTYTITNNKIFGSNNPDDYEDYGFYTNSGKDSLVFSYNTITQTGANSMLIELHTGPIDIHHNTIDVGCWGSDAIFAMTYGGNDITSLQKVSYNTFDLGTGGNPFDYDHRATAVTFASSFGGGIYGYGKFTNVQIIGNTMTNLKPNRRGIGLWNAAGNNAAGNIISPMITGNTIIGTDATPSIGIRLLGLVSNAVITSNEISHCSIGISINASATATVRYNKLTSNGHGIVIDSDGSTIEHNTIISSTAPYSGIHLTSNADGNEIHYNCIVGNTGTNVYGVYKEGGTTTNATYNWWGDSSGPYHPTKNPIGLGDRVSDYVLFEPWLKAYFEYYRHNPYVGEPVTFDASLSVQPCNPRTITSYTWNFDDGHTAIMTTPIIVHDFAAVGDYNVTLTLTYDDMTTYMIWAVVHVIKEPYFKVTPTTVNPKLLNSTFQVNITINDLDAGQRIIAAQARLSFNSTLVEFINVTEGPFFKDFASHMPGSLGTMFFVNYQEDHPIYGPSVLIGVLILPDNTGYWNPPFPQGSGVIATFTFKVIHQERGLEKPPLTFPLSIAETDLFGDDGITVPHGIQNGTCRIWPTNIADLNYDGKVDLKDYFRVSKAFGTAPGWIRWDPVADINHDIKVDLRDVFIVAKNFGWVQDPDP